MELYYFSLLFPVVHAEDVAIFDSCVLCSIPDSSLAGINHLTAFDSAGKMQRCLHNKMESQMIRSGRK